MSKKVLIKNNELIYFSEIKHDFICISKEKNNYVEILEYVLTHNDDFDEKIFIEIIDNEFGKLTNYSNGKIISKGDTINIKIDDNETSELSTMEMPQSLIDTIEEMRKNGYSFEHFENFWKRCLANPNPNSVMRLFDFLKAEKIQIMKDGCFIAYKAIRPDYLDYYSQSIDNHPGKIITMNRKEVVYDPDEGCSFGLHCGALDYANNYGDNDRIIVCVKVDPADVVSVPKDFSYQKIRTCKYEVIKELENKNKPKNSVVVIDNNLNVIQPDCEVEKDKNINDIKVNFPWRKYEDNYLKKMNHKMTWAEIGKVLHRSAKACRRRYKKIKGDF